MNFAFLSKCDDLVSGALVDSFYLWFSTLKMTKEYACPRVDTGKVHDIVKRQVVQAGKLGPAAMELLELSPFREFYESASVKEKQVFVQHLKRYLNMYHPKAGYEIAETKRYSSNGRKGEACLCATKEWHVGDEIRYCGGVTVTLTPEEDAQLRAKQQDFSVMYSVKKGTSCLFLGPARFVNHDCDANCNFIAAGLNSVTFKVIKDIQIGEEITVFYGEHYFGVKNCECLCATCEKRGEGAFKKPGSAEEDAEEEDWRTTGGVRRSSRKRKVIESNDFVDPDVENHDPARSSTISREDDVERIEDIGKLQQGVLQRGSRQNNNLLLQGRRVMADNGQTPRGRKRRSDETESIESPQRDMKRQNIQDTNTPETWQRSSSFLPIRDDQHVYTGNSYQYSQCQYLAYQYPRYPYSAYQQSLYPYFGSVWLNVGIYPHTAMGTDYRTSSHIAPTGPMSQYHDQHATMTTMYADIHGQNNAAQAEYPQVHPRYERMQFPAPNNFCGTSFIPSNDRTSTFIPSPALVDYQAQTFVPSNHTTPTSISPPIFEGSQAQSSIFSNHPTATFIPSPIYEGSQAQTFVPSDHPTPTSIPLPIYQGSQAQTSVARNHPMPISRPPPVYEDSPAQLFESSNHSMPTFIPSPTYEGSQAQPFVQTTAATISSESQESNTESNVMSIDFICSEATQDKWYEELFEGSDLSSLASEEFKCMTCDQGIEGDDIWYCTRCSRHWKIYGLEWPVRKLIGKRGRKSNEKKSYSA